MELHLDSLCVEIMVAQPEPFILAWGDVDALQPLVENGACSGRAPDKRHQKRNMVREALRSVVWDD